MDSYAAFHVGVQIVNGLLHIVLVILALFLLAGRRQDRWGTIALGASVLLAAVMSTMAAQEPIVVRMLQSAPFGLFTVAVVVINWGFVLLLLSMIVLGVRELAQRVRMLQRSRA